MSAYEDKGTRKNQRNSQRNHIKDLPNKLKDERADGVLKEQWLRASNHPGDVNSFQDFERHLGNKQL